MTAPVDRDTRPTADRAREGIFSILHSRSDVSLKDARVIDLFAGSGALGFEAMSRGASWCLFVETDAAARGAIRANIEALGLFGSTRVHRRSASELGSKPDNLGAPFTIAFLDPPYGANLAEPALAVLKSGGWLAPNALVVVEQGAGERPVAVQGFDADDRRTYGAAQIGFYRFVA